MANNKNLRKSLQWNKHLEAGSEVCDAPVISMSDFVKCQPMVTGTNSTPTGIPSLGCGEEGNFIKCKQLNCDTSQLWE